MRGRGVAAVLCAAWLGGCVKDPGFICGGDSECGSGGRCEASHLCSVDGQGKCGAGGRRYAPSAGTFAGVCVAMGPDAGPVVDAAEVDSGPPAPCTQDGDCVAGSGICESLFCVAEDVTVHVATTGSSSATCGSHADPCQTVSLGLARMTATRTYVSVAAGSYPESVTLTAPATTLVGPGAIIMPPAGRAGILASTSASGLLRGVAVQSASGGSNANGFALPAGNTGAWRFDQVAARSNGSAGMSISGCGSLTIDEATVTGNGGEGIVVHGCNATIQRSVVTANRGVGLSLVDSTAGFVVNGNSILRNVGGGILVHHANFEIVNNMIVKNGSASLGFGGVRVELDPPLANFRTFDFNTVADNLCQAAAPCGVVCATQTTKLTFNSDILFDGGPEATGCDWTSSDSLAILTPGPNSRVNPAFVSAAGDNYHLTVGSPCRGQGFLGALAGPEQAHDFDGDPRPGGTCDIGADQFR